MYKPLSLFIGIRYLCAKKHNRFVSIISVTSFIGITLGVAILITVMSIMNGFDKQIKEQILVMIPPIKIYKNQSNLYDWKVLVQILQKNIVSNDIQGASPIIGGQGLLGFDNKSAFAAIQGISPGGQSTVTPIAKTMIKGNLFKLNQGEFNIILGKYIAQSLGVILGDKVSIIVPNTCLGSNDIISKIKRFTISGVFSVNYQYDNYYAFINIEDSAKVFHMDSSVSELQISIKDTYQSPNIKKKINDHVLRNFYQITDWGDENKSFFQALQMEKTMMFFILLLIIGVAIFNLLSSLVMIVNEKNSDIAILSTLGMSSYQITMIFIIQGMSIAIVGTVVGTSLGVLLSVNATEIINQIQTIFSFQFLIPNVYQVNFIPSKLVFSDVYQIAIATFILSFLSTLYPAWSASSIEPSEALRYE